MELQTGGRDEGGKPAARQCAGIKLIRRDG